MQIIKFSEVFQLYNTPSEVRSDCNAITIINIGTSTAIINGVEILPGDQYVSTGNENEVNLSRYRLAFTGAGTQQCMVIRKIYNNLNVTT